MNDDAVPLDEALGKVLRSLEGGRHQNQGVSAVGGVFGRWEEAVGEAMARHVQPVKLDGDHLVVEVSEPAWATQVRLLGDTIRDRLAAVAGARVATIDVRVAGTRRR
jgi:predicted nucleic acid-binding Zn ribbon protein